MVLLDYTPERTVGTGANTYVWEDLWLPTSPARAAKPRGAVLDKDLKVHHLIDFDTKEWKVGLIENLIEAGDIPRILSLRISKSGRHDGYSWNHTNSGCYTVKLGYAVAVEQRKKAQERVVLEPNCNSLKKKVWKLKAPRKIKHFLWQALSGYVASASKLKERHCGTDTVYQRCGAESETINHILFECPPAVQCWALSMVPSSPGYFPCSSSIYVNFDILLQLGVNTNQHAMDTSMFPWIVWYLWKARNDKCFNNKDTTAMDTLQLACHEAETWRIVQITPETICEEEAHVGRHTENATRVVSGRWRCQIDASWIQQGDETSLGFILYEEDSVIIRGQRKCRHSNSPLHAEAECLVWAMEKLSGRGFKHVSFESDCQQLEQIIQSSKSWPALESELDDIETLRSSFSFFSLCFISRSLNTRADSLAKEARSRDLNFVDIEVLQQLAHAASMLGPD